MASRNYDKIICPTHITDPASYAVWLDVVHKNGFVDAEEAKSKLFPEAMAERSDGRDSSKRDTHAVSYLDRFGLIHFLDDKQSKFKLSSLGLCFYELFEKNDRVFKKRDNVDNIFNSVMLDCLLFWHVSFDENTIFPGQLLLKLLLEPRINKKLSIDEFEYTCSVSDYKDTGDYEALVSRIIEFRNSNNELQSASTVERFMTSLINPRSWGVLEKDEDGFCHLNKVSESNLSQKLNSNLNLLNSWESGKFIAENSREEIAKAYWEREKMRISGGQNILLYGVPGSGKSHTIEHELCRGVKKENRYRLVFHPEYMYSDFIGQILPKVKKDKSGDGKDEVTYEFTPGPFSKVLKAAYENPSERYVLIIEEINRGNAPAIFGEVFQLLDRIGENREDKSGYSVGTSEYYINNENIAQYVYGEKTLPIRIHSNLTILATMNTSDQNVFTLDTAFQRRWQMRQVENSFEKVSADLAEQPILDTSVKWKQFCQEINNQILINASEMSSTEDKRLGVYFVSKEDLTINDLEYSDDDYITLSKKNYDLLSNDERNRFDKIAEAINQNRRFPEKVLKYLWDDAFKFNTDRIFRKENRSLEDVVSKFLRSKGNNRWDIFNDVIKDKLVGDRDRT